MTDPPRQTCRGRSIVCPGSCNPLKAHQQRQHHHHHHHHHHRHRRPKYDATTITTSRKNMSFLPDEFTPTLLKSLKLDIPITSAISTNDESISRTSSFAKIALLKVSSSGSKTPQSEETDIVILRKILSQRKLEKLGEPSTSKPSTSKPSTSKPSTSKPSPPKKIDTVPMRMICHSKKIIVEIAAYLTPGISKNVKCIIVKRLNGLTSKTMSSLFLYLMIFIIYIGIHVLLAVSTWQTSVYEFFASSQICGILVLLMWKMTGTILI